MSLRGRALLSASLCILAVLGLQWTFYRRVSQELNAAERRRVEAEVRRALRAVEGEVERLDVLAKDWAYWDDTYRYAVDVNEAYERSNLPPGTLVDLKVNLLLIANAQGRVVFCRAVSLPDGDLVEMPGFCRDRLPSNHPLLLPLRTGRPVKGLLATGRAPLLVACRRILTSEDEGPPHGVLAMGRLLDGVLLSELGRRLGMPLRVRRVEGGQAPGPDEVAVSLGEGDVAEGRALLRDVEGRPLCWLETEVSRAFLRTARLGLWRSFAGMMALALVIAAVLVWLFDRWVLAPLSRLSAQVEEVTAGRARRVELQGENELGSLARGVNRMLEEVERLTAHLQAVLQGVVDGVVAVDREGRVAWLNRRAELLTGWRMAEARGRPLGEVLRLEQEVMARLLAALQRGEEVEVGRAALVSRAGERRTVEVSTGSMLEEGELRGAVVVLRDVTERVRLEQEVMRLARLESLRVMAGGVAHDLNNLLVPLLGSLEVARRLASGDRLPHLLQRSEEACRRARELVERLLAFAKGGAPLRRPVSLRKLIPESVRLVAGRAPVEVLLELPEDLWTVEADQGQMVQLITNLVVNALEAMPRGGTLRVEARNVLLDRSAQVGSLPPGRYVRVSVSDQGGGIPPEVLPRVFEPFFTTKEGGTGLGLAICHSIVTGHGGWIAVTASGPQGTTVTVWLPAAGDIC